MAGKILIFIGSLTNGGAERVTVTLSKYLQQKTFIVTVVTLDGTQRDFYSLDRDIKRLAMDMGKATSGFEKISENLKRVWKFRKIVKKENPDIVLGMITRHAVISIIACFGLPVNVVVSERNYPEERKNHTMWEWLRKRVYHFADLHVVQTVKIAEWLRTNTQAQNINIIPNSVNHPLPTYEPNVKPGNYLNDDQKLILAVGTFKHQKGFDMLIQSVSTFLKGYPNWKMIILGEEKNEKGSKGLRNKFESVVRENRLEEQILFPGRVGNVGDWYERADIFVLSSRYEGFPNALLEAMAYGTACISFDCKTGPADMIEDGENGILVPDSDIETLGYQIRTLMKNSKLRYKLGKNALKVRSEYSEEKIHGMWEKTFNELLS